MRVMVLVKATEDSKKGVVPIAETKEMMNAMSRFNDELVTWVKRCPNPMPGPSEIEIRPLYEMSDLG